MDRQRPLIFLTVGTQLAFPRLVDALDAQAPKLMEAGFEIFGQTLESRKAKHFETAPSLEKDAFADRFDRATLVVAHCGMGTIISCQRAAKPAIMMPRRADRREHRNDHQVETAAAFEARPGITIAADDAALAAALDEFLADGAAPFEPLAVSPDPAFLKGLHRLMVG